MSRRKNRSFINLKEAKEFSSHIMGEKPPFSLLIPVVLVGWAVEKWIFSFVNWVPLVVAVWATIQYWSHKHRIVIEDLNKKWKQIALHTSTATPLEQCEWLNKLLMEVWSNFLNPKICTRLSSIVEKRLKHRTPRFLEMIELQEFSLGSCPPIFGLNGIRWLTSSHQRIMRLGFDWDATDVNILLFAKLAKPLKGTARIVINSLHIKGELLLMPALDGKAILYSFLAAPEVRIGIAFGTGGSQSLPATELPGVSSWLVKILTETLVKTMVEPRRRCLSLPYIDLHKKAVSGIVYVTVVSAAHLSKSNFKGSPSRRQNGDSEGYIDDRDIRTFVEVEIEELTRRTSVRSGSNPKWDSTFNMILHDDAGIIKFNLYECTPGSVKYDFLTSCEIKMRHVDDNSTMFWAIGSESSVIAKHAEFCGKEVEMVVPFEGATEGELTVKLVLKEWQFSDGSIGSNAVHLSPQQSLFGSSNLVPKTGRKIYVTIAEGKELMLKDKFGKSDPYVKLQYGKAMQRTKSVPHTQNPIWNQKFEFDEIGGGEYLKIKCCSEEMFGDDSIGGARVNLEGLVEGSVRDVWVPLEKVNSGELRLQIEAVKVDDYDGSLGSINGTSNGLIELVLIEARDLVAADLRGTSDPYVRVQYGNLKRKTKVIDKTLNPQWYQTFEFPDNGSPLILHVKDHNHLLAATSIGDCVVEYQRLPPNTMSDKWIPLQGVKNGEIHIQVTRKVPELEKVPSSDLDSSATKAHEISSQMKQMMIKLQALIEDGDLEGLSMSMSELESLNDTQEGFMVQLETEQTLLLNKINELGQEIFNSSSSPILSRRASTAI